MDEITYRQAQHGDMEGVGDVFLNAFPESVRHYMGDREISPRVVADIFAICLDAEPAAFFVALRENHVVGYIFAPAHFSRLSSVAIWHGHLLRMCWRWLTGQYGIGLHPVAVAARNWLLLLRESREREVARDARILSIAVGPLAQGHGVGNGLMQRGLEYLDGQGVDLVRLEVRPQNAPAVHLYEKYGFTLAGNTHDTQGEWLIMLRRRKRT